MPSTEPPDGAGLQPDALADPERPRAQQHHPGDHVAQRLLGGETEDDRGERAADGQRLRLEPGDAQRHQQRDRDRDQADQEADRAGRGRVHPAHEGRAGGAADVPGQRPAERDQQRPPWRSAAASAGVLTRRACRGCPDAVVVGDEHADQQRDQDHRLAPGALDRLLADRRPTARRAPTPRCASRTSARGTGLALVVLNRGIGFLWSSAVAPVLLPTTALRGLRVSPVSHRRSEQARPGRGSRRFGEPVARGRARNAPRPRS